MKTMVAVILFLSGCSYNNVGNVTVIESVDSARIVVQPSVRNPQNPYKK